MGTVRLKKRDTESRTIHHSQRWRLFCEYVWRTMLHNSRRMWALRVSMHQRDERIDTYLKKFFSLNRGELRTAIYRGHIRVNFARKTPEYSVIKGDMISFNAMIIPPLYHQAIPYHVPCEVRYENPHYFIINKPAGLVVHQNFRFDKPSVITDLHARWGLVFTPYFDVMSNVVHRLDRFVSGLMIVARTHKAAPPLKKLFRKRRIYKEYHALVHGVVEKDEGNITVPVRKDATVYPSRMVADARYYLPAHTQFWVRQRFSNATLLKIRLHTGRTHQIRVHLAFLGHPIMGDEKYGMPEVDKSVGGGTNYDEGIMLYASRLKFEDPFTGKTQYQFLDFPPRFQKLMAGLQ